MSIISDVIKNVIATRNGNSDDTLTAPAVVPEVHPSIVVGNAPVADVVESVVVPPVVVEDDAGDNDPASVDEPVAEEENTLLDNIEDALEDAGNAITDFLGSSKRNTDADHEVVNEGTSQEREKWVDDAFNK